MLGNARDETPGTPILYDPSKPVAEGGLVFRANFGTERNGQNLLAKASIQRARRSRTATRNSPTSF